MTKLDISQDSSNHTHFVNRLEGATGTGYAEGTHVHKDWYAQSLSYEQGHEQLDAEKSERHDILDRCDSMLPIVDKLGRFAFAYKDGREFIPTEHALTQMSTRCKISSFYTNSLRGEGTDVKDSEALRIAAINGLRRVDPDKIFRFRTYENGSMRAWLTDQYAPVDNGWYLRQIERNVPNGRLMHWHGDADSIYGNVLIPEKMIDYANTDNPEDKGYGAMLSLRNCEIGTRRIGQFPSLFREICLNGCIWGQVAGEGMNKKHRGAIDLGSLAAAIDHNISTQLPLFETRIERFLGIRAYGCGDTKITSVVGAIAQDVKLTRKESTEVLSQWTKHERSDRNAFGVVNAITRAAQLQPNPRWCAMDEIGGDIVEHLTQNRWDSILKRADSFDDKALEKMFV